MADITHELSTINNGTYGREIKKALYNAIKKLNENGPNGITTAGFIDSILAAVRNDTKYTSYEPGTSGAPAQGSPNADMLEWLTKPVSEGGAGMATNPFTPIDKDVIRAFILMEKLGLIDTTSSDSTKGYVKYKYFEKSPSYPSERGVPRWAQPTVYKLLHKKGSDGFPLLKGTSNTPLDETLAIGDDDSPPFITGTIGQTDKIQLSSSDTRKMKNPVVDISSELLRTLIIIDRSGYFDTLVWCESVFDINQQSS